MGVVSQGKGRKKILANLLMRDVLMDFDDTFIKNLVVLICSMAYSRCFGLPFISRLPWDGRLDHDQTESGKQ